MTGLKASFSESEKYWAAQHIVDLWEVYGYELKLLEKAIDMNRLTFPEREDIVPILKRLGLVNLIITNS